MESIKVKNWLEARFNHPRRHADAGSRIKIEYQPVYDMAGVWHLEKSGESNLYLDIQSHADSCDINIIMARYANGETDVLQRIQGMYGDVTNVPTNYAEIMNQQLKAKALFMGLSSEVREKYHNSVEEFMASFSTKEGWEAIGFKFGSDPQNGDPQNGDPQSGSTKKEGD